METTRSNDSQSTANSKTVPVEKDLEVQKTTEETKSNDGFVVDWDENDPDNPLNWSSKKKGINLGLLSTLTFVTWVFR